MFCARCGVANDDNAHRCVGCGHVLARPGEPLPLERVPGEDVPAHHLVGSILVTLFCCQVTGIVAIVFAALTMGKTSSGDYAGARKYSKQASIWMWVSFGVGAAWMVVVGAIMIVSMIASSMNP